FSEQIGQLRDICNTLFPWNKYNRVIEKGTFRLLWDRRQSLAEKEAHLRALIETTEKHAGLVRMRAIEALSRIAEGMDERDLELSLGRTTVATNAPEHTPAKALAMTKQLTAGKDKAAVANLLMNS